jgi:YhgE/Pip-like protein
VWLFPLVLASVAIAVMTAFYMSAVTDPVAHLHGLPVQVVNQDQGATVGAHRFDVGQQVQSGLLTSPEVAGPLRLTVASLAAAEQTMDRDGAYATVVIPSGFTARLLTLAGMHVAAAASTGRPQIEILTNQRAGTLGVGLATGVLQPALGVASSRIGRQLTAMHPAGAAGPAGAFLADPVTVTTSQYRPLPANTALGSSAFYLALLTMMCGFLGGTIVHTSVDAALGYAPTELGPRWRLRRPLPITRLRTLLIKWTIAAVLTAVITAIMLAVAVGAVGMDGPNLMLLWLYTWLCAASVAAGTIVLLATLGAPGQVVALLLFVYAGLASAGGTVPIEALPTALRWLSQVEPLRQILSGTRAILYFDAQANAGLTRGVAAAGAGLLFWLAAGTAMVRWYDRKGLHRTPVDDQPERTVASGQDM